MSENCIYCAGNKTVYVTNIEGIGSEYMACPECLWLEKDQRIAALEAENARLLEVAKQAFIELQMTADFLKFKGYAGAALSCANRMGAIRVAFRALAAKEG